MRKATASLRDAEKEKSKLLKVLSSFANRSFEASSPEDDRFFAFVIGRRPSGTFAVLKRCRFGHPLAFASFPVINEKPFPTIFWLTCPYLLKACGKLESALYHKYVESEIEKSEKLKKEMLETQSKMKELKKEFAKALGLLLPKSFYEVGIGGVKNLYHVKCLHAHLAASFAGIESPVSRFLYEALTVLECSEDCYPGK